MNERSILKGIGDVLLGGLKGSKPGTQPLTTIEHRCPVCKNALDPSWTQCPYCEAKKKASGPTSRPPAEAPAAQQSARRGTRLEAEGSAAPAASSSAAPAAPAHAQASARSHTQVDTRPVGAAAAARAGGGGRRLTGIVTTFTWSRLGELFKVYDGRNYVGSGDVAAENNRLCDIHVPDDQLLSSAHFLILCQSGKYIITDNLSTNGTFLNDEQIDTRGTELPDKAVIKAGATVFVFQKIVHAQAGASTEAPLPDPEAGDVRRPPGGSWREDTVI